ncbi:MAG: helix-turn-helix domain-containing protein [Oscillospiraceae bacterium]|jgi:transcriptional regulator with XRE-family HTH domain|nr:helix-turn-helix domain-containing protein [Oscillospiraceae bacterium]
MFAERVKALRKKMGLSQAKFAEAIKSKQSTVGSWESGAREPGFSVVRSLAKFFGVSTDYLLGLTDEEWPAPGSVSAPEPTPPRPVDSDEAWEVMRDMYERQELRALFSTARKVSKEDIEAVDALMQRMARESGRPGPYDTA